MLQIFGNKSYSKILKNKGNFNQSKLHCQYMKLFPLTAEVCVYVDTEGY